MPGVEDTAHTDVEGRRPTGNRPILDHTLLAERWGVSPRTILNMVSADPASLPPLIRPPGARGARWRLPDVEAFESRNADASDHRRFAVKLASAPSHDVPPETGILNYNRLALRWLMNPRTLANIHSDDAARLPPTVNLPGARGPRWRLADVEAFEADLREGRMPGNRLPPKPEGRKRGRPRIVDLYEMAPDEGAKRPGRKRHPRHR